MRIKSLLLTLTFYSFVCHAQNSLTMAETIIPQSGGWLTFNFSFDEENVYTTYQFKIETPEGLSYITDEEGDVDCTLGDCHTSTHTAIVHWNSTTRVLGVGVTSLSSSLLTGTSGMLISIPIDATGASNGSTFTLKVKDITFIRQNGTKDHLADANFTISVGIAAKPGDANGDGEVTIADVVAVVNYITANGNPAGQFIEGAADVDGVEGITIADAIAIVNMILSSGSSE